MPFKEKTLMSTRSETRHVSRNASAIVIKMSLGISVD
jgi:hypothetical protein